MKDALDVATDDPHLTGEIALLAELMVAVAHTHVSLYQAAIDAILHPPSTSVAFGRAAQGSTSRMADFGGDCHRNTRTQLGMIDRFAARACVFERTRVGVSGRHRDPNSEPPQLASTRVSRGYPLVAEGPPVAM